MKKLLSLPLALSGILGAAEGLPQASPAGPIREIAVSDNRLQEVRVTVLQSTLIELPDTELVKMVYAGDTKNWEIGSKNATPSRYLSVKVQPEGAATNIIHIISDKGIERSLMLRKVTGPGATFDPKVVIVATESDQATPVEWIPAGKETDDVKRYQQEAETARHEAEAAGRQAEEKEAAFRSAYPGLLNFHYRWDHKIGDRLGVEQMFSDDKFFYIKANPQETPALSETKDGKPSLINFRFANGVYYVPKLVNNGSLVVGKVKMPFSREQ